MGYILNLKNCLILAVTIGSVNSFAQTKTPDQLMGNDLFNAMNLVMNGKSSTTTNQKSTLGQAMLIDAPMPYFPDTKAGKEYIKKNGTPRLTTYWGAPHPATIYDAVEKRAQENRLKKQMLEFEKQKKRNKSGSKSGFLKGFFDLLVPSAIADDSIMDPAIGFIRAGEVNCRDSVNETGYFRAVFEELGAPGNNPVGFGHPTQGAQRRAAMCAVLKQLATLIKLNTTGTKPDIIFPKDNPPDMPTYALAAASAFVGSVSVDSSSTDNGTLHYHIASRQDPTPELNRFDALIYVNWNPAVSWSVDSSLNANTYNFNTIMTHEVLHALGFTSRISQYNGMNYNFGQNALHNTFNLFTYSDVPAPANRYLNLSSTLFPIVQVPNGNPPNWFINETNYYKGVLNSPGAVSPGERPIYSPASWAGGSSLSHFDDFRASGVANSTTTNPCQSYPLSTTYTMNPFACMGMNPSVHQHEKEVLCHLGYQVLGLCEQPTPWAAEDHQVITGNSICIPIVTNDSSFTGSPATNLSVYEAQLTGPLGGATITYHSSANGCTNPIPGPTGAKSVKITNYTIPVGIRYRVLDQISNRFSNTSVVSVTDCHVSPNEYICNGDFELGIRPGFVFPPFPFNEALQTGWNGGIVYKVGAAPFWQGAKHLGYDPDIAVKNNPDWTFSGTSHLPHIMNFSSGSFSVDLLNSSKYAISLHSNEWIATRLKTPVVPGYPYRIQFDVSPYVPYNPTATLKSFYIGLSEQELRQNMPGAINFSNSTLVANQTFPVTTSGTVAWHHFDQTFTPTNPYEYLVFYADVEPWFYGYVDNFSLTPVNPIPTPTPGPNNIVCAGAPPTTNFITLSNSTNNVPLYMCYLNEAHECVYNFTDPAGPITNGWIAGCPASVAGETCCEWKPACGTGISPTTITETITPAIGNSGGGINITVTGLGPFTYQWSNGATTEDLTNIGPGTYSVIVKNQNGCMSDYTYVVGTLMQVTLDKTESCERTKNSITATVTGGVPGYTYTWFSINTTNGVITPLLNSGPTAGNLSPGTYGVTVTDSTGQVVTSTSMTIDSFTPLSISYTTVNASNAPAYNNGSVTATVGGGVAPYTYFWSGMAPIGPTSATSNTRTGIVGSATNAYSVYATDARGCPTMTLSNIKVYNQLTATAEIKRSCLTNPAQSIIFISASGGHPPYSYLWNNGSNASSLSAATGTYSVTVKDSTNTTVQQVVLQNLQIPATVPPLHTVIALPTNATGTLNNGSVAVSVIGGTAPYVYTYTPGTVYSNIATPTHSRTGLAPGAYTVQVETGLGCKASKPFNIIRILNPQKTTY